VDAPPRPSKPTLPIKEEELIETDLEGLRRNVIPISSASKNRMWVVAIVYLLARRGYFFATFSTIETELVQDPHLCFVNDIKRGWILDSPDAMERQIRRALKDLQEKKIIKKVRYGKREGYQLIYKVVDIDKNPQSLLDWIDQSGLLTQIEKMERQGERQLKALRELKSKICN